MKINISLSAIPTTSRQNLYHFTDLLGLRAILTTGKIGTVKANVSFTRDKRYTYKAVRDGVICFVFDQDMLKKRGYKITPFAFTFRDDSLGRRYESEETVSGPVDLVDGLLEIVISYKTKTLLEQEIQRLQERLERVIKLRTYIQQDNWCREAFDLYGTQPADNGLWERQNARYLADRTWRPRFWWTTKACDESKDNINALIDEDNKILNKVRIGNV